MGMSNIKRVNSGCGRNVVEGWINIDKSRNIALSKHYFLKLLFYKLGIISRTLYEANWSGKNIIRHDIRKKLPLNDESVDYVYCSHVLEHLTREEAEKVCQDVYESLSHLLNESGFKEIYECNYKQGKCADLNSIENPKRSKVSVYFILKLSRVVNEYEDNICWKIP